MSVRELLELDHKTPLPGSGLIVPVLLSGGAGTRLWPLSRETYPKQLLSLLGDRTLLQQTASRVSDRSLFAAPLVIAHEEHRFVVAEQLKTLGVDDAMIILEPVRRNTAPAAAVAALVASEVDPDASLLVMPVDHLVRDMPAFHTAIAKAAAAAEAGKLTLFGITPTFPATGYGYVRAGKPLSCGARVVSEFVEKPDLEKATRLLSSDEYLWNSGIFMLPVQTFLEELERLAPDVLRACRAALAEAKKDLDFLRLPDALFAASPSISIDYAILEKTEKAAVVPAEFDWNDIGSFAALWTVGDKDESGNVLVGDVVSEGSSDCYLRGDGPLVAALGVDNLIVTATADVVLVTTQEHSQDVGKLVNRLKDSGRVSATQTRCVHRPWGYYQQLHVGERFQVKCITVNPGCKLSLQKHYHRAEHWVVASGTALVTRADEELLLRENESLFIPLGAMHRLENPGKIPLNLIEVQSGSYLGEDDIVRFEDVYNRVN